MKRGLPPGPNVSTQLRALRRKASRNKDVPSEAEKVSNQTTVAGKSSSADLAAPLNAHQGATDLRTLSNAIAAFDVAKVEQWFASKGWQPFEFQRQVWKAFQEGRSGLLHATTGSGKTLAVWVGALLSLSDRSRSGHKSVKGLRVLWITPMRALAADSGRALQSALEDLIPPAQVAVWSGDTDSATRAAIQKKPPLALVTTPESLTLMLARQSGLEQLQSLDVLIVDEWHELLGNKRGVQLQLAVARLLTLNPSAKVWGLSATLGNLEQAMQTLLFPLKKLSAKGLPEPALVQGALPKELIIDSLIPESFERFPWGGHLGLRLLQEVIHEIEQAKTCLVFTNTRSQSEIWFHALLEARPDWAGLLALHHGSLDKSVRDFVEQGLKTGMLKAVVCTSSLDLGVDFLPVERVLQIGSPKGVARLMQRAGRSGHAPGRPSRVTVVPTHALELMEAAAARYAVENRQIESRVSPLAPLDVLVQHLVTVALGSGFKPDALYREVRLAEAYSKLPRNLFDWAVKFVEQGGESLKAYPDFHRITIDEEGVYRVPRRDIARRHLMSVGTIVSDAAIRVAWVTGGALGTVEEGFVARLKPGDCFSFAGRVLELVRIREMTAYVRKASKNKGVVPQWVGGKMPLSSELAKASLEMLRESHQALKQQQVPNRPELKALQSLFATQMTWSALPQPGQLLVEELQSREGHHLFVYPFEGRMVNIGLASLLAYRAARDKPGTFSISMNDYGFELLSAEPVDWSDWLKGGLKSSALFASDHLLEDILACLNASELAQRRFREIARIAGLVFQGYPGAGKSAKQLQASSGLFFEVFSKHDQDNPLLAQARQEALAQELEMDRLSIALAAIRKMKLVHQKITHPTPFAFPLLIERLRESVSTEKLSDRIARMVQQLEAQAGP